MIEKQDLVTLISSIRKEIGHEDLKPDILEVIYDQERSELFIITSDRPEKSLVIGKGGWVVGKLKERLNVAQIHIEAQSDIILRRYRMQLALKKLEEVSGKYDEEYKNPLLRLGHVLKCRMESPYFNQDHLDFREEAIELNSKNENSITQNHQAVVALSGGVDSSFTLIVAQKLGFHPIAVTVNPGDIILPKYFREKVENLTKKLSVEHIYLDVDMAQEVEGALEGRYHPCGRCSKLIEEKVLEYTADSGIPMVIFGDLLATGAQSLSPRGSVLRINLPAMLAATKGETKSLAGKYGVTSNGGYGCPLLKEVKKKYNHMNRYSVQRILRETRSGILEPGESLDMIMSLFKK